MRNDPVVVLSRAMLMRNWSDLPFPGDHDEQAACCYERAARVLGGEKTRYYGMDEIEPEKRSTLAAKGIFSHKLMELQRGGTFALPGKYTFVEIGGEDWINIRSERPGFQARECFDTVHQWERRLYTAAPFAYDEHFGYLTASPANVGTGLKMSVVLHLPLLTLKKKIAGITVNVRKYALRMNSLYVKQGEEVPGDLYELGTDITLGISEQDQLERLMNITRQIADLERQFRQDALIEDSNGWMDRIGRSWGILRYARQMSHDEFLHYFSSIRLGAALNALPIKVKEVDELLQKVDPELLGSDEAHASAVRATRIRNQLKKAEEKTE